MNRRRGSIAEQLAQRPKPPDNPRSARRLRSPATEDAGRDDDRSEQGDDGPAQGRLTKTQLRSACQSIQQSWRCPPFRALLLALHRRAPLVDVRGCPWQER